MTDAQLQKDVDAAVAGITEYFEEKKSDILLQADAKNQEVKEKTLEAAKETQK